MPNYRAQLVGIDLAGLKIAGPIGQPAEQFAHGLLGGGVGV